MYWCKPFLHLAFAFGILIAITGILPQVRASKGSKGKGGILYRSSAGEDICMTTTAKSGACVPLVRCRRYWGRNSLPDLTNSSCGKETTPRVCCPLAEDEDHNSTDITTTFLPENIKTLNITISPENESSNTSWRRRPRSFSENCGRSGATLSRIVGGQDSALGAWPWMAAIYLVRRGVRSAECAGALITSSHVLTAAHCTVTSRRGHTLHPRQLLVRLGDLDLDSNDDGANPIDLKVRTIIKHEEFNVRTFQNDVAILELERAVDTNDDISTICLPYPFVNEDLTDRNGIVAGWGSTRFDGPGNSRLQEVQLRIWQNDLCREVFRRDVPITEANLCAGDGDKDACRGDSGGPLMLADSSNRYHVIGLVSFGKKCAEPGIPGVYTRVTTFLDWIQQNVR